MVDILIVEDNAEMAALLSDFLQSEGYSTKNCYDGKSALREFEKSGAKLVLLDVKLPELDGLGVCRKIRENANTPIFMISAMNEKDDKLLGLLTGADDYIEKPYDIDILIAKINGIFARHYQSNLLTDGFLRIDKSQRVVYIKEEAVDLSSKEYDLLLLMFENSGRALSKEYLFETIWGDDCFSEMQTLTVHINRLRQKLEIDPKHPRHINTVWGLGYRYER